MMKHIGFVSCVILLAINASNAQLYDETWEKLQQLRTLVDSAIRSAESQIVSASTDFQIYAEETQGTAEIEIYDEANRVEGQITDIKNLAESAEADIDFCLLKESELDGALASALEDLGECIIEISNQLVDHVSTSLGSIEVVRYKLDDLESQLVECDTGSIICVSPISRQIDEDMIELPELIESEVSHVKTQVETLTRETDQCSSVSVSTYVSQSTSTLEDIANCANDLLGKRLFSLWSIHSRKIEKGNY